MHHRRGILEPSEISPERRCSSRHWFRTVVAHNTCPAAAPLTAGLSTCNVRVGDVGPLLACRNCTGLYTCPMSVTVQDHLLECALWAQLTPGHVYLIAHTMSTAIAICRCQYSFVEQSAAAVSRSGHFF